MKNVFVYVITNNINKKLYIGKTNNLKRRWNEHKTRFEKTMPISCVIFKYGHENFNIESILNFSSENDAYMYEAIFISKARKENVILYNITDGGLGPCGV